LRPILNLITCPSNPGARGFLFVVIPFDHLRKKGAMMQQANVSHGGRKKNKTLKKGGLPCVRREMAFVYKMQAREGGMSM
jgi:hypothetical protein